MTTKYFDYNAPTPLDPRVRTVMDAWYIGPPGNAGSRTHVFGHRAKDAVEIARQQVADLIGAEAAEVVFTSGATESDNLVALGLAAYGDRAARRHIIATAIEHQAMLQPHAQRRTILLPAARAERFLSRRGQ